MKAKVKKMKIIKIAFSKSIKEQSFLIDSIKNSVAK